MDTRAAVGASCRAAVGGMDTGGLAPPAGYGWMYATINGSTQAVSYTINGTTARVAVKVS